MEACRILCTVMLLICSVFAEWGVEGSSGNVVFLVENDGSTYITTPPVTSIPDTLTGKVNGKVVGFSSSLLTSGSEPVSWFDIINKPNVFPPESHTQDISTINDLQTALNNKAALTHTHGISDVDSLQNVLDSKEPVIVLGTDNKYLFRDKTWKEIDWSEIINKPSTYSPTSHIHIISDVTELQTALNGKENNLGNPSVDGQLLSSTTSGTRSWVNSYSHPIQSAINPTLTEANVLASLKVNTFGHTTAATTRTLTLSNLGYTGDNNANYYVHPTGDGNLHVPATSTTNNKKVLTAGSTAGSLNWSFVDWDDVLNKPTEFPPATHTQNISTINNLQSTLDDKQPLDSDLTAVAALTHSNRHVMVSNGSSWTRRALVEDDLPSLSAAKITSGTLDNARLSFDPSSFAKLSLGTVRAAGGFATSLETGRDVFASGLYTYRFMRDALNKPAGISLGSVLTWGHGVAGAGQLAVGWTAGDHNKLVFRSLRDTQNDWWNWKQIYHTGYKPTPDDIGAAPAITGTAYKVLSIQSDGSGVKTGCLRDLGNYAAIDNAERFAIIHSTDQAAISLQSQGGNRFWISSAPSVLNIGGSGTTAPENGQLQIYHNSRVVIPSLPLLVGKATATTGNPYKIEVEGNQLIGGNATIGGHAAFGGTVHLNGNIKILNKAGNGYIDFLTRNTSGTEAVADLSNVGSLAMEAASPFLTITPYSNGGIVFNTPSSPSGQHAHWITRSANDGVLRISREVNGESSLMMAFAPNVNDILFDSDLYIQGEVFAHDKITIYSNPTGGNIIVPYGLDIRGGTEGSGYTGRLELRSSIASLSLVNTTSRYTVATDFVMEESDHVVSSGIKHEVYEQITSSSANYNPHKSLLRLWHSEAMTIVFANLPSNPTGYYTAAMFTVYNPTSVTHSVNGVSIWPNQSRQFVYDYSSSKWMTSY